MSKKTLGESSTLLELVHKRGGIRIPMIQRDYAQGRQSWANARKRFLDDLKKALLPDHRKPKPLHLDFVYGTQFDEDGIPAFCPLDGQQRLTTLFLLHWCLAARENRFGDFQEHFSTKFAETTAASFSYQVRPGGRSFFEALVKYTPPFDGCFVGGSPSAWIRETPWFRTAWERDPTVAGTLNMLDAIEKCFLGETEVFYDQLVNGNRITFQVLDLGEIGLHDDLYLRMNARGLGLSKFETFKARYEKHLEANFPQANPDLRRCKVQDAKSFAREIDKTWIDFIWCRYGPKGIASNDTSGVDAAFMNLFRAVALVSLGEKSKDEFSKDVDTLTNEQPDFDEFKQGGWLNPRFTRHLIHLFEAWTNTERPFPLLGVNPYFDEVALLDQIAANSTKPFLADYLQFAAYTRFITHHGPVLDSTMLAAFREWMRIVRNLTVNSDLGSDRFQNQLKGLDELVPYSGDIVSHLDSRTAPIPGFNEDQCGEEKLKASLLLAHKGWRELIHQAEEHGYFRGQIDFLLDFSGAKRKPVQDWTAHDHLDTQLHFRGYLRKAELMFAPGGLAVLSPFLWQRALLATGDYLFPRGQNRSFLKNDRSLPDSWKGLLRGDNENNGAMERRTLLKSLWDKISCDEDLSPQLEAIIEKSESCGYWRDLLVHTPAAIEYCSQRWLRKTSDYVVNLLRSPQLKGYNAELSTYCLWCQQHLENNRERFKPLSTLRYVDCRGTNQDSPHIELQLDSHETLPSLLLYCNEEGIAGFTLWIEINGLDEALGRHLRSHGFSELRDWLVLQPEADPYNGVAFLDSCATALLSFTPDELAPATPPSPTL